MLSSKKVAKEVCAAAFSPTEILLRKSGKQYFGSEKALANLEGTTLTVDETVASEFGITIEHHNGKTPNTPTSRYYVVETWDRELQSVTECLSLDEAISAANILLNEHLKDVGHGDEVEVEYDETSDWCRASTEKLNAWCNYQGEWDAFIKKHE